MAPLHWGLEPWSRTEPGGSGRPAVRFVRGVPTELNRALLEGEIDLTLISSIEFLRHRQRLKALPDFSISTLGPVSSVMLFHTRPWTELGGCRIAVTTDSATSVELLRVLLEADGMRPELVPAAPDLDAMLGAHDGALLIGDAALHEGVARRPVAGRSPYVTDLGERWYDLTRLPFTFAVWASRDDRRPSDRLVRELRAARRRGLGNLAAVAEAEAPSAGVLPRVLERYLSNFRYHLEPPDRDGLLEFGRRALGRLASADLRFWDV